MSLDLSEEDRAEFNYNLVVLAVLLVFLALNYVAAGVMSISTEPVQRGTLPATGGVYGPFDIAQDNTSTMIKINRTEAIKAFDWDALEVEILDQNKAYVSSFGAEFWKETGSDSDGRWVESEYEADLRYFFAKKGQYYLKVETSSNSKRSAGEKQSGSALYALTIRQQLGSAELFKKVGFVMLWVCGIWFFWTVRKFEDDSE